MIESKNLNEVIKVINNATDVFDVSKKTVLGVFASMLSEHIIVSGGKNYLLKISDGYDNASLCKVGHTGDFIPQGVIGEIYGRFDTRSVKQAINNVKWLLTIVEQYITNNKYLDKTTMAKINDNEYHIETVNNAYVSFLFRGENMIVYLSGVNKKVDCCKYGGLSPERIAALKNILNQMPLLITERKKQVCLENTNKQHVR